MSRKAVILFLVLVCVLAAGAYGWLRVKSQQPMVSFTPDPKASEPSTHTTEVKPEPAAEGTTRPVPAAGVAPAAPAFSPASGEVLEFSASIATVSNVATLRLLVRDKSEVRGKETWHLQAFARTQNAMRMVFALEDQFDSYSSTGNFTSLQYEMRLNERGEKVTSIQELSASGKEAAPAGASVARVLPGTRDPLGFLQFLRSVDWTTTREVHSPVYDGRKLYEVKAERIGSARVGVPAGNYSTTVIAVHVFDNGVEMKDASFKVYMGKDAARTPALLEAVLPFAEARVELMKRSE